MLVGQNIIHVKEILIAVIINQENQFSHIP